MAKFAHIITDIPVGSRVLVKARGRFVQFDEIVKSGAIGIIANREAYPIRITLRPTCTGVAPYAGGITVIKPMDSEFNLVQGFIKQGGEYDVTLASVLDFNPGKIELYTPFDKRVGPWVTVAQVVAASSPETRVINRYLCAGCSIDLGHPGEKYCDNCKVIGLTCEHPKLGGLSPKECGNPLYPGYGACEQHLVALGIAYKQPEVPTVDEKPKKKRVYCHTPEYYAKKGIPVPRDEDPRQMTIPLEVESNVSH